MGINSDIEAAIKVHGAWKAKFRDFLSGKAGMALPEIGQADACQLGKWLEDGGRRNLSPEDHAKSCELHAHFHQVAGEVVHHIKHKDFMAARNALAPGATFDQASHAMCAFFRKIALHGAPKKTHATKDAKTPPDAAGEPAAAPDAVPDKQG